MHARTHPAVVHAPSLRPCASQAHTSNSWGRIADDPPQYAAEIVLRATEAPREDRTRRAAAANAHARSLCLPHVELTPCNPTFVLCSSHCGLSRDACNCVYRRL